MMTHANSPGWKKLALLSCFGLLFAAGLLEAGLRVAAAIEERQARNEISVTDEDSGKYWAVYDPDLGYRMNPKYMDLNPDGLRDRPIGAKAGRFRLLMLGDSIGFYGDDLDDTFVAHMRKELRKDPALDKIDVINGCIKGYTNYQEVAYLKKFGAKFEPDLVGIEFCLNDVHKFLMAFAFDAKGNIVPNTYSISSEEISRSRSWTRRIMSHSYLLVWLRDHVKVVKNIALWQVEHGFAFDYRYDINTAWKDDGWADIEKQLTEFRDLGRQKHFAVFLVVFPVATQYNENYLARNRDYVLKPQRKLKEICARLGIPYYDLYSNVNPGLFGPDAIHLTKEGRERVGQLVAHFIVSQELLKRASAENAQESVRQ
jgi:lysophospholipase L1-like esterase